MFPPDGFAVSVTVCPLRIVGALGVIAPAVSAPLTCTVTTFEARVSTGVPLSLTCNWNSQLPVVTKEPVDVLGRFPGLHVNEVPRAV